MAKRAGYHMARPRLAAVAGELFQTAGFPEML